MKNHFVYWIAAAVLVVVSFAVLSFTSQGEVIETIGGTVQKCDVLGGNTSNSLIHATIKSEDGRYIIASLPQCNKDMSVDIEIVRGALYFNTVYSARTGDN